MKIVMSEDEIRFAICQFLEGQHIDAYKEAIKFLFAEKDNGATVIDSAVVDLSHDPGNQRVA